MSLMGQSTGRLLMHWLLSNSGAIQCQIVGTVRRIECSLSGTLITGAFEGESTKHLIRSPIGTKPEHAEFVFRAECSRSRHLNVEFTGLGCGIKEYLASD